ncbi:hypothetical protein EIN_403340 [Entamoeba invadens IP1]|uniref:Uncharacterized protein n=1 Tax=Entamoeba invadens IP1 TaxID=370355 RepID=A0A0A1U6R1_ENTIV|nr:hypothetical protein EIN_403340 [Entamoeba invadens IP1]ELP90010.1 hypothetical protein EIN_403340 [Entamoeba invadens IP1]|eukprot:XP_004256781.1 hypothetical protein EIN_403340 [Entamoeba invadens IP1]
MNSTGDDDAIKICLIGDSCVGKTCLVNRYVTDAFDPSERETVGVNFISTMAVINGQSQKVTIWDTAGQEKFRSMIDLYFRKAAGAVVVYDVMSRESFQHLGYWIDRVRSVEPDVFIMVVGNKVDKPTKTVTTHDGEKFASDKNCNFMEVSALDGTNVKKMFQTIYDSLKLPEVGSASVKLSKTGTPSGGCC